MQPRTSAISAGAAPKDHDGTIITARPDVMWGTDLTTTVTTDEGTAHVFVAVDHCTCESVGIHAAKSGNRLEALEPIRQAVRERFIRTLEENLLWVRHFRTLEELRLALLEFQRQYNHEWLIQRHGYRTPAAVCHSPTTCLESAA